MVAPGIAEALIATAAGLFAAIPAVYFYNYFTLRVKKSADRDGRLLARVPEHLGAELHVMPVRSHAMPKVHRDRMPAGRDGAAAGARVSTSLAEINVVPLVDVMLVLLIIFMVTAPMMQQGLDVSLPQARRADPITAQPVYVTIPPDFNSSAGSCRSTRKPVRHRFAGASGSARRFSRATTSRCSSAWMRRSRPGHLDRHGRAEEAPAWRRSADDQAGRRTVERCTNPSATSSTIAPRGGRPQPHARRSQSACMSPSSRGSGPDCRAGWRSRRAAGSRRRW